MYEGKEIVVLTSERNVTIHETCVFILFREGWDIIMRIIVEKSELF